MVNYTNNLIPIMTSNNTPKGLVTSSSFLTGYEPYKTFDEKDSDACWIANIGTQWLSYEFDSPVAISKYTLRPRLYKGTGDLAGANLMPRTWTFQGSNDSTWTVLDSRSNITAWEYSTFKEFTFNNDIKYKKYRINITLNNGSTKFVGIGDMQMMSKITNKILIRYNGDYYYHNSTIWISLGATPSSEDLENYGMSNISSSQITEFESIYGINWKACAWNSYTPPTTSVLQATPHPQILTAKNSIQLTGVESATFRWTATGNSRVALSVDDGVSYHAFKNGVWINVTNDMSNAMTSTEYSTLTWEQYKKLSGESNFLKHQYYIPANSTVDDILITASLIGYNKLADGSDYSISYDQVNKKITYSIKKDGTYSVNYIDGSA